MASGDRAKGPPFQTDTLNVYSELLLKATGIVQGLINDPPRNGRTFSILTPLGRGGL